MIDIYTPNKTANLNILMQISNSKDVILYPLFDLNEHSFVYFIGKRYHRNTDTQL